VKKEKRSRLVTVSLEKPEAYVPSGLFLGPGLADLAGGLGWRLGGT